MSCDACCRCTRCERDYRHETGPLWTDDPPTRAEEENNRVNEHQARVVLPALDWGR